MAKEFQEELPLIFERVLTDAGIQDAKPLAQGLLHAFIAHYRGERLYVGKKLIPYSQIQAEFTGTNHRQLAQHYGISLSTVYDILHG